MLRQEDWQAAFGQPDASFKRRVQGTLQHLEEEKPMKKLTIRTVLIALALLLAATGAVYAAVGGWSIGDYYDNVYQNGNVNAPPNFASGFDQNLSQTAGDVIFRIRDAYVDDTKLTTIITFARADGKPALFLLGDLSENDSVDHLFRDGREDSRTIREYARETGMTLHTVNTWFEQGENRDGGMDAWIEADGTFAAMVSMEGIEAREGKASLVWVAQEISETGEKLRASLEITLPVEEMTAWEITVDQQVEGLPVTLDTLYLRKGRMGLHVDIAFSLDAARATEAESALVQDGIWFEIIDPDTGERLPGGATTQGSIDQIDETHLLQTGDSLTADFAGDSLTLRAYDCWEKTRYGTVTVKIQ